jgi:DNA-binding CsgD family transcriptional regulator
MPTLLDCKSTKPTQWLNTVVAAFDWLHAGVLISNASGELLFANDAAEQILDSKDGLALDENGRVTARSTGSIPTTGCVGEFRAMLTAAQKRNGLILSVARPSGRLPLTLTLRPTHRESSPMVQGEEGTVFVLIHDPERLAHAGVAGLRELYGLTLTEARLANFVMQGKTIEDCAGLLGIRRSTVKMHLQNLYGKTGVQRQSELVSLMFKTFGNIRCSQQSPLPIDSLFPAPDQEIAC